MIGAFLSLLLSTACATPTPTSAPTVDLNAVRTEAAATVLAQVTRDLALTPSATPVPSLTATIPSTSTPTKATSASPAVQITLSGGTTVAGTIDQAEWVSQSIADGAVFAPGETFTMTWSMKNVGTSAWTGFYMLRFYSGDLLGAPDEIVLDRVVLPGDTVEIPIPMRAPAAPGDYRSDWVLSNESRSNFKQPVFLKIVVANPATPTPTATRTPTPTP
jgi:hypothetical protein